MILRAISPRLATSTDSSPPAAYRPAQAHEPPRDDASPRRAARPFDRPLVALVSGESGPGGPWAHRELRLYLLDSDQHLRAQVSRHRIVATMLPHELLYGLFQAK